MGNEDRAAEVEAKLVLREGAAGVAGVVAPVVVCVEDLVAEVLPKGSVGSVGAGLGAELNGAAGEMAVVGSEVVGIDLELTEGVLGGNERGEVAIDGVDRSAVNVGR